MSNKSELEDKASQRITILLDELYPTQVINGRTSSYGTVVRQYKPFPDRRNTVDFWIETWNIVIEVEGGIYTRGRHVQPQGFIDDMEKYNRLAVEGVILIRVAEQHIDNGMLDEWIKKAIKKRENWWQDC